MNINGKTTRKVNNADHFRIALRSIRLGLGLSQQEVATRARVSRRWLSRFETGEEPEGVELQKALSVASVLGFDTLLTSENRTGPEQQT